MYIGRYDWGHAWRNTADPDFESKFLKFIDPTSVLKPFTTPGEFGYEVSPVDSFKGGYFMAMDAEEFRAETASVHRPRDLGLPTTERIFGKSETETFGAYVQMEGTEYEFGMEIFILILW